jgi:hypothetical protein
MPSFVVLNVVAPYFGQFHKHFKIISYTESSLKGKDHYSRPPRTNKLRSGAFNTQKKFSSKLAFLMRRSTALILPFSKGSLIFWQREFIPKTICPTDIFPAP